MKNLQEMVSGLIELFYNALKTLAVFHGVMILVREIYLLGFNRKLTMDRVEQSIFVLFVCWCFFHIAGVVWHKGVNQSMREIVGIMFGLACEFCYMRDYPIITADRVIFIYINFVIMWLLNFANKKRKKIGVES